MQPCTIKQIAEQQNQSEGAITAHISTLFYGGWIERRPHPIDRGYQYREIA